MNEYLSQKEELVGLGLLLGPFPVEMDPAARRGIIKEREPRLKKARADFLALHGPAEIKKRFSRTWHEVWPNLA